ncbi:MAG: TIGR02710 family CRISPR-associated CARF protein, partial [Fimbriimonadales bacterium]|nr:TIGR02710 family CRISPR-associated CARF protein [Fimbriimonadales bacterium]
MDPEQERKPRFVVCTVGGTPEPIVFCLNSRQPEAVLYVVSEATRDEVAKRIVPNVAPRLVWSSFAVVDPDKPSSTFQAVREEMRRLLTQFKGQPGDVLADITGGTKAMAAGLALAASVMGFRLSYVAGARSEGGTGTVLSGTETPVEEINPLDWFAVPQLETANRLLAMGYPGSAARVLREASKGCSPSVRKRLQRLESLCTGLASIDRFDFRVARNQLKQPLEGSDQPERLIGWEATEALKSLIDHWQACQEIVSAGERPQARSLRPLMLELLANARRRARRGEH